MTTPCDFAAYIEEVKGWPIHREEGVHHGRWDREIHGVTVCWKANLEVMQQAGERGDEMIIGHESLYDPYDFDFNGFVRPGWEKWGLNEQRRAALSKHDLVYLRLHSSVDILHITTGFAHLLGLGAPEKAANGAVVWDRPESSLSELVAYVKQRTGLPSLRVCAPRGMNQHVHRVGLLIGGAGLDANVGVQPHLIEAGCDVFISGESDNYGLRYAQECGVPTIETSHEVSENPGIRMFQSALQKRFPSIRFTFYENTCPYVMC